MALSPESVFTTNSVEVHFSRNVIQNIKSGASVALSQQREFYVLVDLEKRFSKENRTTLHCDFIRDVENRYDGKILQTLLEKAIQGW